MRLIYELVMLEVVAKLKKTGFYIAVLLPFLLCCIVIFPITFSSSDPSIHSDIWSYSPIYLLSRMYFLTAFYNVFYASEILTKDFKSGMHKFIFQRVKRWELYTARYAAVVFTMFFLTLIHVTFLLLLHFIYPAIFSYSIQELCYRFFEWNILNVSAASLIMCYTAITGKRSSVITFAIGMFIFDLFVLNIVRGVVYNMQKESAIRSMITAGIRIFDYSPFKIPFDVLFETGNRAPLLVGIFYIGYAIVAFIVGYAFYKRKEYK